MSRRRKMVYRHEPIKKYRMHKVKKNWVVKGGVAGAMLVGTVASPASNLLAHAAENEVVDATGEGVGTVASSDPVEEVGQQGGDVVTAGTDMPQRPQPRATENPDGTTTWVANEDAEVTVSDLYLIDENLNKFNEVASDQYFENGLHMIVNIDNLSNKLAVGDEIKIPIRLETSTGINSSNVLSELIANIDGIGGLAYSTEENSFILKVETTSIEKKRIEINLVGRSKSKFSFTKGYDPIKDKFVCLPTTLLLNDIAVETYKSTNENDAGTGERGIFSGISPSSGRLMALSDYKVNGILYSAVKDGKGTLPTNRTVVQISRATVESESEILSYTGMNQEEDLTSTWDLISLPKADGSGKVFQSTDTTRSVDGSVVGIPTKYVETPDDATNEEITEILKKASEEASAHRSLVYTSKKNSDGTYTFARAFSQLDTGYRLVDSPAYLASGAISPVDFFEKIWYFV